VRWRTGEIYGVEASGQMIGLWPACVGGGQPVPGGGVLSHPLYVAADGAGAVAAKPVQMARSHGLAAGQPGLPEQPQVARDRRLADAQLAGEFGDRAVAVAEFLHDGPAAGVGEGLYGGGGEFWHGQIIAGCL